MSRCAEMLAALLVLAPGTASAPAGEPVRFYIAAGGNDAWTGRICEPDAARTDGPFATFERARGAVRAARKSGLPVDGVEVTVRGGTYVFDAPFELNADDSGTADARVVYRAAPGEEVRITGGRIVDGFRPVEAPEILERIDKSAWGKVLAADLKALGIDDFGPVVGGLEVFFKDEPMKLSRWPNDGFVRIADIVVDDGHAIHGIRGSKVGRFAYDGDRPERWLAENAPWLHGYWFWDWSEERHRITRIDTENRIIDVAEPYHGYGYRKGQWYYAFNMLSEVDAPGEWYLDREMGVLYFWPPGPLEPGSTVVSMASSLLAMRDVSHVTFRGFIFEAARGGGVTVSGGERNEIVGCVLRNLGTSAVSVSGGAGHGVIGCDIYLTGGGGISLDGGDRTTLTPAGHFAENNHVHHYARLQRVYHPGIQLNGVGNRAAHNLIHNAPHMGMGFGGNDHVIEFNEIHSVCYESNDAGAIYTGRNWTMRGHVIRHNYLHHIQGFEDRGCVGIYLDDMFSSADVVGNVFYKVTMAAFIGGGRDCTVANNIFVDCNPALHIDARALGWAHYHADMWLDEAREKGTLSGIAFDKPPYSERYPRLVTILEEEPKAPRGNLVARNVVRGGKWDHVEDGARPYIAFEDNLIDEDPLFVDEAARDFRLRDGSPALHIGFEPIPVERIGLYEDPRRASWPVEHTVRATP